MPFTVSNHSDSTCKLLQGGEGLTCRSHEISIDEEVEKSIDKTSERSPKSNADHDEDIFETSIGTRISRLLRARAYALKMAVKTAQSFRDRTLEFQNITERLKKSFSSSTGTTGPSAGSKSEEQRSAVALQSEFNKRASKVGLGIHQTSQKLSKLAKLAKRTSVFDDPTMEIQELTALIKQDITTLNSAVVDLQLLCNSRNENGNISSDTTSHSTTVVDDLKNRLMSTTKEFKEVLTMRTENLKVHENRRQLFSSTASKESTNPFVRQRPLASRSAAGASSAPPPPWAKASTSFSKTSPGKQVDGESQPLLQQQQQQQQQMVPLQDTYMQSRAEALQNVESTIHELSNIFNQLATLVSEQGEIAIRIDENMDDTLSNVEGAQGALLKYLNSISSNRWLMIKIFFVLIFFLMVFLFFVA
ncbi:Syntaxin-32, partial [Cucurbita argyrosperma subsp. sororia]